MRIKELIEGFQILAKYYDKGLDYYGVGAGHDIIYAYETNKPVTPEDVQTLVKLGWFQEDLENCPDGDEFKAEHYDPEVGWTAYT